MSNVVLMVRVVVSLAIVLGLLWLAARAAAKRGMGNAPGARRTHAAVEVVARQGLGRNSSVVVVRTAERALVLGVTDSSVSLLLDSPADVLDITEPDVAAPRTGATAGQKPNPLAWKDTLENLRERTLRRS